MPYTIKGFRGGWSDETDKGIKAGSWKNSYGLDIHKRVDSLTGGSAMATILDSGLGVFGSGYAATTITGLVQFFVPASDGSTYCFFDTGSIFARSGDGAWTFVYNDENGKIKGAAEWKLSTGTNYLFWATDTSVARKELQGADVAPDTGTARWTDATQDWKTTLTGTEWHTMDMASGQLMIANDSSLASVDYDGNFLASTLDIRPFNIIKAVEERDDYVILGSFRRDKAEEGHMWSWITTATNWVQKKRIPAQGVNALLITELNLAQGGLQGEIYHCDFRTVLPLHAIPGGGYVNPGGVTISKNLGLFGIYGGTSTPAVYSYGRSKRNRPFALDLAYRLADTVAESTVSSIGAIANINDQLLVSWGSTEGTDSSRYGVDGLSATTSATARFESLEWDGGHQYLKKQFDTVKLIMTPLPAGTSISVPFKLDKESAWRYAVLGNATTTFTVAGATEAEFTIGKFGQIYEIGLDLNPSGGTTPEVTSITTYMSGRTYEH